MNVSNGVKNLDSSLFSFSNTVPEITGLSPSTASPVLKNDLTITGTNFGTDSSVLTVNLLSKTVAGRSYLCNIQSITNTQIVCRLGGGHTGDYKVEITKTNFGVNSANPANASDFSFVITLSAVTPASGSLEGGSILTLTGTNFSKTLISNQILIGPNQDFCSVTEVNSAETQMKCRTNKPLTTLTGVQTVSVL